MAGSRSIAGTNLHRKRQDSSEKTMLLEICLSMNLNMNNRVHCAFKTGERVETTLLFSRPLRSCLPLLSLLLLVCRACTPAVAQARLPKPDHIIVVIEENKGYSQIIGSAAAPYLNVLAQQGASFSNFLSFHHPSQPNYLEIFSGSNQGVWNDTCPATRLQVPSLGGALIKAGLTFRGYAEDLPRVGAADIFFPKINPSYARKHCPWVDFADVAPQFSQPLTAFPARYETLPTLAFVIPNLWDDMHNGRDPQRITQADTWLQKHLSGYVEWAKTHNSLLIVTWDEDNHLRYSLARNHIPTIMVGQMVQPGVYKQAYNHHDLLRTLEAMYDLPLLGASKQAQVITDIWKTH